MLCSRVQGLGFMVQGLGFRVRGQGEEGLAVVSQAKQMTRCCKATAC